MEQKAGRLAQQFGKFGEGLVLWWLGKFYNYSVALVDHEGADIVAHNNSSNEHLAISVKSIHAASIYYDKHNQEKLRDFAEKFGKLTPAVAFVFVWGEQDMNTMIDVFLFKLDDFDFFCANEGIGFSKYKKDEQVYLINNGTKFETLKKLVDKSDRDIKHLRMQQTNEQFNTKIQKK